MNKAALENLKEALFKLGFLEVDKDEVLPYEVVDAVATACRPEDVFSDEVLAEWAYTHGFKVD